MAWMAMCWNGEKINPDRLNPYVPKVEKTAEQRKEETKEGMLLLKAGLRQFARSKGKG